MKKTKQKVYITTMSKKKFDALSKGNKRMVVAQDVIDRINLKQITPVNRRFCEITSPINNNGSNQSLKSLLEKPSTKCEACAKGGLFLSYIGIVNDYKLEADCVYRFYSSEELHSDEMQSLMNLFEAKQLSLIETAFEGKSFDWNVDLTNEELDNCINFRGYNYAENEEYDAERLLTRICQNIIKNKGTFKP